MTPSTDSNAAPRLRTDGSQFTIVHVWDGGSQMGIGLELRDDGLSCMLFEPVPDTCTLIVIVGERHVRCEVHVLSEERVLFEGRRAHRIRCTVADPRSDAWLDILASRNSANGLRRLA